jgi:hypothetical protein
MFTENDVVVLTTLLNRVLTKDLWDIISIVTIPLFSGLVSVVVSLFIAKRQDYRARNDFVYKLINDERDFYKRMNELRIKIQRDKDIHYDNEYLSEEYSILIFDKLIKNQYFELKKKIIKSLEDRKTPSFSKEEYIDELLKGIENLLMCINKSISAKIISLQEKNDKIGLTTIVPI